MERAYGTINENMARAAKNANSMSDYRDGSATEEYRQYVDLVYDIVEKIAEVRPHLLEKAIRMAERYSRKLADYYNAYYRNEASCPSILISGGGNFPVRKKERQNSRRETLMNEWHYLSGYAERIRSLLTMEQPILSSDENAIEALEEKLADLTATQERMKAANKAIRMKDVEEGNGVLASLGFSEEEIESLRTPDICGRIGFPDYELSNNNANIHRVSGRLESLKKVKEAGDKQTECEFCKIVEDTSSMRIKLIFEGKPEPEVREVLKSRGFRWAPSQGAWQRQLTANGKYAAEKAIEEIGKLKGERAC